MEKPKTNTNTADSQNVIPDMKKPAIFYPMLLMIIALIICLIYIFNKGKINDDLSSIESHKKIITNIFISLIFCIIVVIISISLLPNFKELNKLFQQISNVTYMIIYTIFLILFFTMMSNKVLDKFYYIIVPITILLGGFIFFKSAKSNYVTEFNINYERIKSVILLFCVITIIIVYYNIDPGGIFHKYFGYSLLLTIIIALFAFLYLIIVLTLPDTIKPPDKKTTTSNFLENFTTFSVYGSLLFIIFLISITIMISTYPGGFFKQDNKMNASAVIIFTLLICILWSILLIGNIFPEISDKKMNIDKLNLFKKSLLMLLGIVISILIIVWIVYIIKHASGQYGITALILNILIVLVILSLIYKTINVKLPSGNHKKNAFFDLLMNILFYIPCLFTNMFDSMMNAGVSGYDADTNSYWYMLVLAILLFVVYFSLPIVYNRLITQGGKLLVNQPIYTNTQISLGTYEDLNGNDAYDYNYALSFWIFIDSFPPNTNPSYTKYASLLNYGDKPNVLYNASNNTLLITMKQKGLQETTENKLIEFDDEGNRILYKKENMLLQKWHNIILNYNGGILDIFLNGELTKSNTGVVEYYTLDSLTIGQNDGFKGGICNVVYYNKTLNRTNIDYIYNMLKNKNPPITKETDVTIVKYLNK